jgi:MFS family permease
MAALGVATLVTSYYMNWRAAFWFGAIIAVVGAVARTRLRETPDFLEMKRQQMRQIVNELNFEDEYENQAVSPQHAKSDWKQYVDYKTLLSYFFISCGWPLTFYLTYVHFNPLLKENFGYTPEDIIQHNFYLSVFMLFAYVFWSVLSFRIYPLKILKVRWFLKFLLLISLPFLIPVLSSPFQLFLIQSSIIFLTLYDIPAEAVFIYHLPIYRRFTYASFLYALSRAFMYIITSFGLVYLGEYFGPYGLWCIAVPLMSVYLYGIIHFEGLERAVGLYPCSSQHTNSHTSRFLGTNKNERVENGAVFISES